MKDYDAGFDTKYSLTPSLTLDTTYRTDFAQVEVDQQQVNLTRFNLFFPEKRDFFLENSGIFALRAGRQPGPVLQPAHRPEPARARRFRSSAAHVCRDRSTRLRRRGAGDEDRDA